MDRARERSNHRMEELFISLLDVGSTLFYSLVRGNPTPAPVSQLQALKVTESYQSNKRQMVRMASLAASRTTKTQKQDQLQ